MSLQNDKGFSGKTFNILGLPKRKEWPKCQKESSWQVRQRRICQKRKGTEPSVKIPNREMGENQGEGEPHLGEKKEDWKRSVGRKRWTLQERKTGFKEKREGKQEKPS